MITETIGAIILGSIIAIGGWEIAEQLFELSWLTPLTAISIYLLAIVGLYLLISC